MSSTPLVVGSVRGGQVEHFEDPDRLTVTVQTGQSVTGGQLVELVTGQDRQVKAAGAASLRVMGVALHDAAALTKVTVAGAGVWRLTASGAIQAGDALIAAATGKVAAAGATPDARTVIGFALKDAADGALVDVRFGGRLG
jgi:hypothetical protein